MNIETLGGIHQLDYNWTVIAGPCSAETKQQLLAAASGVASAGAHVLRAGIYKPRTNSDSWQGPGDEALEWMQEAKRLTGLAITTEANDARTIEAVLKAKFDILWIGSRAATYFPLLEEVGRQTSRSNIPIILKRGMGSEVDEWIGAAGYILKYNRQVILCERGIKGFGSDTRNTLDLQGAKIAQIKTGLPVVVDVSHAAGRRDLINSMARAVKAAGFNGLMIETHPTPDQAWTDAKQQISLSDFAILMKQLKKIPTEP
jgi:3-deoxy-7-phosphoheptulonate synthase